MKEVRIGARRTERKDHRGERRVFGERAQCVHVICARSVITPLSTCPEAMRLNPVACWPMRWFVAFTVLLLGACIESVTATQEDPLANAYTLESVDLDSLPAKANGTSGSRWVLSGSLTLQPDGFYVLSERDSVWNGRAFSHEDETEGGTWMVDGSLLTLSDTASEMVDTYGPATLTYHGSIVPNVVQLTVLSEDSTEAHVYRYGRSHH
jgi:hypothetical protein